MSRVAALALGRLLRLGRQPRATSSCGCSAPPRLTARNWRCGWKN
jgi:hypothetical protein